MVEEISFRGPLILELYGDDAIPREHTLARAERARRFLSLTTGASKGLWAEPGLIDTET